PGRGLGLEHGEGPGRRLGVVVFGSRHPRAEGRAGQLADPARRAANGVTPTDEHPDEIAAQEQLLRSIDYLRDLDRVDIARLIGSSEDAHFQIGAVIVSEGEVADSLYLLASGTVEVSVRVDGAERSVRTITAPATFGDLGLLLPQRTATVRALTDVQVWRIPRQHFERLLRERPALGLAVARAMAAAWLATGLAPPAITFGGFTTSAWVTAVAALGLSASMSASGLLFRAALMLLRVFPPTHRGQLAALLVGGVVVTPLAPTVFGRVATMAPVARDLSLALGHSRTSAGSAAIAFAGIL